MMNLCLEKRCRQGFAYHPIYPIQVDFSGGYRYLDIPIKIYRICVHVRVKFGYNLVIKKLNK